ncbi:hypothetical protein MRB53_009092 [Persea americana]|uniref:Uncharacterized protein n=1 Tax=Persea americana TaxID=3435 RepID=A0ACC2LN76_PERAE|nr:hypothetical protein MRB53_009092 [Persea americana]
MVDSKDVASNPSTPATPGTPGAPLFGGYNVDKSVNGGRSALNNCSCFSVNARAMEEGSMRTTTCAFTSPAISLARKAHSSSSFAGAATGIVNQKTQGSLTILGLAASGGLAVMIVILSTGHISGAHLNPSVTIAFAALRHFPWKQVPMYKGAQVMASICPAFALQGIFHPFMGGGVTVPKGSYGQAFALEFIISFNLMFVITAVAIDTSCECL